MVSESLKINNRVLSDNAHYEKVLDAKLKRSIQIALAEAGLIRYFEPKYNNYVCKFNLHSPDERKSFFVGPAI